ncbi:MAG: M15 family metallopeptidase [Deltaproteobacteria bacterium]|nr:M15 family metallopeptidase [Deltaproteobacteria bacterium]MDZ4347393.1 M15 family metallopeptidase [Candidatus Binatia bacterium]
MIVDKAQQLVESAHVAGIEILKTSTLRPLEEEAEIFAIGRTKPGKKVTNAEPGKSWHNFGLAFDVVPLVNGKAVWDSPFWKRIGELGKQVGLFWVELITLMKKYSDPLLYARGVGDRGGFGRAPAIGQL